MHYQLAGMPVGREHFDLAVYTDPTSGKTKVMATNGHDYNLAYYMSQVDIYDVETDSWETVGNFPFGVYAHGLFAHNNIIWHLGGVTSGNTRNRKVHRYNAEDDTWTDTGNDLPVDATSIQSIMYNDGAY